MSKSLGRILTLTKRNLKEIVRDPLSLIFLLGLPLFMEIFFYLIFHKLTSQFEMKYLAPGIVVFAQAFLTLFAGILISTDRNTSFLTRLYVTKTKSFEFIFSYTFALLPISVIQSVLFFIVGGLIDFTFWSPMMILGILVSIVTAFLFIGFGILFGSICNEKSVGGISSIVIIGQSVLSGMWFPLEGLSDEMLVFMKALPFKNATMLIQNVVNGYNDFFTDIMLPFLIIVIYTVVIQIIAIVVFKNKMKVK